MLTRITCPHCGHVGATAASLPRVLICSQCEHGALIRSGTPARSSSAKSGPQAAPLGAPRSARHGRVSRVKGVASHLRLYDFHDCGTSRSRRSRTT